ncbi:ISAzo13 family transposase [Parafrankia discariae]|nr:ISAzo13 family transposase [Parafrankia discariae]
MAIMGDVLDQLSRRFAMVLPHLDERQRRLVLATEAWLLGHGGVRAVARVAGVSETTVRAGVFELEAGGEPLSGRRVRRPGGGRRRIEDTDPAVVAALLALVEPEERGDPTSPLRWTTKSLRHLAEQLTRQGHPVSPSTVRRLLRAAGFSLQANSKTLEGKQHPDRDAQFRYLNDQVVKHQKAGEPVISVDAKKKEMLGQLPNPGREWRPKGDPVQVEDHSFFTGPQGDTAIPYGVYDLTSDAGWVNVGVDHDTSAFAVASIRRWWQARGQADYPQATRLLVTADAGGSNSYRFRAWKAELAALAADTGLAITVCHFPPATSKWNKIEHRLFSQITINWRGRPLTSHEVVVNTIAATRTRSGLRVEAHWDTQDYPVGVAVSKARIDALPIEHHMVHRTWNYTIHPTRTDGAASSAAVDAMTGPNRAATFALLAHPRLTGMSTAELDALAARLAPEQAARREQRRYQGRNGPRRNAPGAHSRPLLSARDRVLVTVVHLRQICSQRVLADLLEVAPPTIGQAVTDVRHLLHEQNITIEPTTLRFTRAEQVTAYARTGQYDDGRPLLPWELSDPALTGMSRADLAALIEQVSVRQAAAVERRRHQQRGRQRLPGTRGGVFPQKITSGERVLAALLHHRKVCTGRALAELFGVSHRTIGTAFLDVRPILEEDDIHLPPAPVKYRSAEQLLASVAATEPATPTA